MHVLWDGKLVDSLTFSTKGHTETSIGWVHETLVLTATSSSSSLVFADASPTSSAYGAALGGVTLNMETIFEEVNGFGVQATDVPVPLSGPYGKAELQMLAKIPRQGHGHDPGQRRRCAHRFHRFSVLRRHRPRDHLG